MSVRSNLAELQERINRAAGRTGRDSAAIKLVVVTKTVGAEKIEEAIECGASIIGENRVHEAALKRPQVERPVEWHMIGHLQSRKAREAVRLFDMVQSVESISTARALQKRCAEAGRYMPVLIEVNTSKEVQKYGVPPDEAESLIREAASMPNLRIEGLMTMAALVPDPEEARPSFRKLRELARKLKEKNIEDARFDVLSMGMSSDFEVAIEEGSTMVRIGAAVFAEQEKK
jgi:pyridoxal phosphate enzyme (YggS family)